MSPESFFLFLNPCGQEAAEKVTPEAQDLAQMAFNPFMTGIHSMNVLFAGQQFAVSETVHSLADLRDRDVQLRRQMTVSSLAETQQSIASLRLNSKKTQLPQQVPIIIVSGISGGLAALLHKGQGIPAEIVCHSLIKKNQDAE